MYDLYVVSDLSLVAAKLNHISTNCLRIFHCKRKAEGKTLPH